MSVEILIVRPVRVLATTQEIITPSSLMKGQASSIRWNSLFAFLSSGIRLLSNLLLFVGIARFYGPETFGQFTFVQTLATVFILFADFGLDVMLTTEVARQRHNAATLFVRFMSLKFVFSLAALLAMWSVPFFHPVSSSTRWLITIFSFYVAITAFTNFYFALFKGFEQLQYETKITFLNNLILLIALVILGIIGVPFPIVAMVFVATRAIGLIASFRVASRLLPGQPVRLDFHGWREIRGQVFTFGLHLLFGNLYFILDTILLSFWKGDHEVGIYQSAFRLITAVLVIPDVIINALMPVLSRFHEENRERWDRLGRLMNKTLLFFGLPIGLIIVVYADQIIQIVYGSKAFAEAIPILRIFGVIVLVRFGAETFALMLTTSRRQRTRMAIVITATVLNFALNYYAIPRYGPLGAALVSLTTNIFVGVGYVLVTRLLFLKWMIDLRTMIPFVFTFILGLVLWNIRTIPLWYISPAVALAYSLIFYFFGYSEDERKLLFARQGP